MRQLLEAGVHFGHHPRRWDPRMATYIFGVRNNVHIIDLQQTVPLLHHALEAIKKVISEGGRILFVGTKRQASEKIAEAAQACGQYYVNHRWLGGMLTNWETVSKSINRLEELEKKLESQSSGLTKKEQLKLTREKNKLDLALSCLPFLCFIPAQCECPAIIQLIFFNSPPYIKLSILFARPFFGLASTITPHKEASPSDGKCFNESFLKNLFIEF